MIKVEICCGTNCYIMGASELISMGLDKDDSIELTGSTCKGYCKDIKGRPPYVVINGVLHSRVSKEKLVELIKEAKNAL